jgi:F-type H+-transporting ATPase subunit a
MGLEFLARVRRTTGWLAGLAALWTATYTKPSLGLAVLLGAAWSLVNLFLLERLVVALTGPWRIERTTRRRLTLVAAGMLALFVAGAGLLARVPPVGALIGFSIPIGVIVLKAAAQLLLPSRLWRRVVQASPRAIGSWVALLLLVLGAAMLVARVTASGEDATDTSVATAVAPAPTPEHGEPAEEGPQKFANLVTVLSRAFPDAPWARFLHHYEVVAFSLLVAFLVCLVAYLATRRAEVIPKRFQNAVEAVVEALNDFIVEILGPRYGPRYVPFLGTLFVYILAMNLFGLVPFMDSPTSNLNVTVGLALVVFVYAQSIGIRELGVLGYIDHLAGNPRTPISWGLVPLMLPIHVMGELAKPISLSCRLFGNIFGEDMLLVAFVSLGITTLSFLHLPIGLPLQLPFLFLALLTSTLQALVFMVLSTIYFLLMLPHEEHGAEGEAQHAH